MIRIPNRLPTTDAPYRIAIINDNPSHEDIVTGEPLTGAAGNLLRNLLVNSGINPDACLLANVCQYRANGGNHKLLSDDSFHRTESLIQLRQDIATFKPNLIILLGDYLLRLAGETSLKIGEIRGTFFMCRDTSSPFYNIKCLPVFHPSEIQKRFEWMPLLRLDLHKARKHGESPDLPPINETIDVHLTATAVCDKLTLIPDGATIALDIEGDVNNITCLSIATSPTYAFSIELSTATLEEEMQIIRALGRVLRNQRIGKILQNSLYDNFALSYRYNLPILNVCWDTMLSGWEIYPELPKALGVQASIWTDRPAYKHERTVRDWTTHLKYCCKDSLTTYELALAHQRNLASTPDALAHFHFNMRLLPIFLYMQLKGINYDKNKSVEFLERTRIMQAQIQDRIDHMAGRSVNINSPKQLCSVLYDPPSRKGLGFPPQHPKIGRRKDVTRRTSNVDAILDLQKKYDHPILSEILAWRKLDKIRETVEITTDPDGRVRCAYNPVGTDTGRLACYKSNTGSGTNLQTITKKLRCLYRADPGYYFFQCDLAGADGWTVAARADMLGDSTMLDDYRAGLKPAKIIALLKEHGPVVNQWSRDKIREEGCNIGIGDTAWLYFACKRVQHGTNYGLGPQTMANQILKDGYKYLGKTIIVTQAQCKELQRLYRLRYFGVQAWQNWVKAELYNKQQLSCASGHVRRFFGRADDNKTFQTALSHEPQANTTYATNKMLENIWHDPDNQLPDGSLIIQPVHQVHDAVCGQFPIDRVEWATAKLQSYANVPLTIGRTTLTIPTEGIYGDSWGDCDENGNYKGTF